jgi:hypothetical protein
VPPDALALVKQLNQIGGLLVFDEGSALCCRAGCVSRY